MVSYSLHRRDARSILEIVSDHADWKGSHRGPQGPWGLVRLAGNVDRHFT
jgi:hypothetical protein